jgi:GDPmannose 4,6-dehydratase
LDLNSEIQNGIFDTTSMHRAMIIGSGGQDGTLLSDRLRREGCTVLGVGKHKVVRSPAFDDSFDAPIDILDRITVEHAIRQFSPDTIFYLAAYHHSAESLKFPDEVELYLRSQAIHVHGLLNVLEAVRSQSPQARVFYAASSHCFGAAPDRIQTEANPLQPNSAYGITKTAGVQLCRMYRANHGVYASCGFLYNHESPLRRETFLSMKIVRGAVEIAKGRRAKLVLGDLAARVDWGYAPDYVDAMVCILQCDTPDDFIISTGESHSVEEFVSIAFDYLGVDWRSYVEVQASLIAKQYSELVGDNTKLRTTTGWSPSVTFAAMVRILIDFEQQAHARNITTTP